MGRAVIHIGLPRTGTTTFQAILAEHRDALARNGVLYPELTPHSATGTPPHISHQHLGEALDWRRPRSERRELTAALGEQIRAARPEVVLISYERLALLRPWHRGPAIFRELFAALGYEIEVLMTVRPQDGAINSQYAWRAQFLREACPFKIAFQRDLRDRRYDYVRVLEPWAAIAGNRPEVVPLQDARSGAPLVERLLDAVRLGHLKGELVDGAARPRLENRSPGPFAVEISRRLRATCGPHGLDNRAARQLTEEISTLVRQRDLDAESFRGLDDASRTAAREAFGTANDAFADAVWGEPWDARVASEQPRPPNDLQRTATEREEAIIEEVMTELHGRHPIKARGSARLLARAKEAIARPFR